VKITVDMTRCQDHGQCAIAAPDVFRINDEGRLEHEPTADESLRDEVEEAADVCPVQAIALLDG
jgi:ferredoxin